MLELDRRRFLMTGMLGILGAFTTTTDAEVIHASTIPAEDLIQPADFAAQLKNPALPKPVILHVGFRKLYLQAHIPGSDYAGAGGDDDGLKALSERVAKISRDSPIVIYCGCCPWSKCPNVAPAYDKLHDMGFRQVKVLYMAKDFGTDWADLGYPTVSSS
jgi:thiosulfate/3-mercaptopyruvate sulfurtransferase